MSVRQNVEKFILDIINEENIDHSLNLFESGLLTSLYVLDLLTFLEDSFNVIISDEDVDIINLQSIDSIVRLIERLKTEI